MSGRTIARDLLRVVPLGGRLGAEITGLDPAARITPGLAEILKDALLDHKVLVLRGHHLTAAEHRRLLSAFGAVAPASAGSIIAETPGEGTGDSAAGIASALRLAPAFARWATEGSWQLSPPAAVSLRALAPPAGGECTLIADTAGAYRDLPGPLRALADRSWAVHTASGEASGEAVVHPVARLHTETGDRGLLLGGHARRILGLTDGESRTVVQLLQSCLTRPHNVLRWAWRHGDVLVVDARAVQLRHRAGAGPMRAALARLETAGNTPLGVNGQHSHVLLTGLPPERRTA